jgi:hypothetical protein
MFVAAAVTLDAQEPVFEQKRITGQVRKRRKLDIRAVNMKRFGDEAIGDWATVSGGGANDASGVAASVSGGFTNIASGTYTSVSGGDHKTADTGNCVVGDNGVDC